MPTAIRLNLVPQANCGAYNQIKLLASIWMIDGHPGLWRYDVGVSCDTVAPAGCVVAETNGSYAIFVRQRVLESILCAALGVNAPV